MDLVPGAEIRDLNAEPRKHIGITEKVDIGRSLEPYRKRHENRQPVEESQ